MSSEKEEISLIVYCDDLPTLKFRNRRECCLEHPPNAMSQSCDETVKDKFGIMSSSSRMTLDGDQRDLRRRATDTNINLLC